jgi:hypothetical protein
MFFGLISTFCTLYLQMRRKRLKAIQNVSKVFFVGGGCGWVHVQNFTTYNKNLKICLDDIS